jgi:2-hydroxychromene-2-carboxylate isomerase
MEPVRFYYDLGSPYAYLTAHRIDAEFDIDTPVEWIPVLLGGIFKSNGRQSWADTRARHEGMEIVEARGVMYNMPMFQWPDDWPNNGLTVMRVAAWAHENNAGRRFAKAAFAEQFNYGNPLSELEHVRSAAERADLDPDEALAGAQDPIIKAILKDNTEEALVKGIVGVPTIGVGDKMFWGDDQLAAAVAAQQSNAEV